MTDGKQAFNSTLNALISGNAQPQNSTTPPAATVDSLPPNAKPYLKGAGFHVPPGTANGPIVLDDCQAERERSGGPADEAAPEAASEVKAPGAQRVTSELIIRKRLASEKSSTREDLAHARRCNLWVRVQPERPKNEQLDRASAIRVLTRLLREGKCDRKSCRVNRFIGCYHVARLFGGDAESLTITAIREMIPLVDRDPKTDFWTVSEPTAAAARALWARMLDERMTAEAVTVEVEKIRHPEPLPLEVQRKKSRLPRLIRSLPEFSVEELKTLLKAVKATLAETVPGRQSDAA